MNKLNFSQRVGVSPIKSIQINSMDDDLRNSIWNAFYQIFELILLDKGKGRLDISDHVFFKIIWIKFLKSSIDTISEIPSINIQIMKKKYYDGGWDYPYTLIEFLVNNFDDGSLQKYFNTILEEECSGYRFINGILSPVIERHDIQEIDSVIGDDQFLGASTHIRAALSMLSDRKNPDYRNSIKESISAVESMVKVLTDNPNATFGEAMTSLERGGNLHAGLKKGFEGLYGYTNDKENGIRHAVFNGQADITQADARYFLVSCSAFVNYLKELSNNK